MVNQQLVVVSTLAYVVSAISFSCTVMSLVLIRVMKKWNGFLAILWCESIFSLDFNSQIIY